jgi:hypothetical protein
MRNRIVRSLVLVCSLIFALPQGWCCLFASPVTEIMAAAKGPNCSKAGLSGCCCPCTDPGPTKSGNIPAKRVPLPNCPCTDRKATLPTTTTGEHGVDLALVATLPDLDLRPHLPGAVGHVFCVGHSPPHALHVLHCLWLC